MNKSKKNKSGSLKTKLLLALLASLAGISVFYSDISKLFQNDISGCTDFNAVNYDPLATVDDSTCYFAGSLPNHLKKDIDKLKDSDWIKNEYLLLKDKIKIHFSSIDQENSQEEIESLDNLDMAYMYVLNQASTKNLENCFKSGNNLYQEVYSFYKKFKSKNNDIRNAYNPFRKKYQINSHKIKVKEIFKWDKEPQLFFIGCKHKAFKQFYFMPKSVVIDPFRYLEVNDNVKYIPIGRNKWKNKSGKQSDQS